MLLTVLGLRERGHRTVLVAHPEGELAGRASEGHDLIRLAPRAEVDLHAAWKLSRIVKDLRPTSCTRTIRMPSPWLRSRCRF